MLVYTLVFSSIAAIIALPCGVNFGIIDRHSLSFEVSAPDSTTLDASSDQQEFQVTVSRKDNYIEDVYGYTMLTRVVEYDLHFTLEDPSEIDSDEFLMACNGINIKEPSSVELDQEVRISHILPEGSLLTEEDIKDFEDAQVQHSIAKIAMNIQVEDVTDEEPDIGFTTKLRRYTFSETVTEIDGDQVFTTKAVQHVVDVYETDMDLGEVRFVMKQHEPIFVDVDADVSSEKLLYSQFFQDEDYPDFDFDKFLSNEASDCSDVPFIDEDYAQDDLLAAYALEDFDDNSSMFETQSWQEVYQQAIMELAEWWDELSTPVKVGVLVSYIAFLAGISFLISSVIIRFYDAKRRRAQYAELSTDDDLKSNALKSEFVLVHQTQEV